MAYLIEGIAAAPRDGTKVLVWPFQTQSHRLLPRWYEARWGKRQAPHPTSWVRNEGWIIERGIYADKDIRCCIQQATTDWSFLTKYMYGLLPRGPQIDNSPIYNEHGDPAYD